MLATGTDSRVNEFVQGIPTITGSVERILTLYPGPGVMPEGIEVKKVSDETVARVSRFSGLLNVPFSSDNWAINKFPELKN